jgi:hypothetical protein
MMDPILIATISGSVIVGFGAAGFAGLKAWNGWLDLKRLELNHGFADHGIPPAGGRIEIADLKERVRKLEAIAAGIDM